ncbi:AurF N-oxygenase family protein [Mycobacteroides abscessus]|uniref:AurF N-oxygenase family protein n=1 Tax=Mycobacteroides abscessus TaxID=36809 RepID=UPI0027E2498F|nr:diiron oxygenase [Mycobacteroides abscessus]
MNFEISNEYGPDGRCAQADLELSTTRRLKASAEKYYDPEIDIDWAAPPVPGMPWLSERRVSLIGTKPWEGLTAEQRLEFGRQQFGSILIAGIWFEAALGVLLYHDLMVSPVESSRTRYLLTEIGEEARHSTMFARVVEKMGEGASPITYRLPRTVKGLLPLFSGLVPVGPTMYTAILMAEEVLDRLQREGMNDPAVQPHARTAMRIHVIEEARHVAFAKEEILRGYRVAGPVGTFATRMTAATTALLFTLPALLNPQMYRAVGINPLRGILASLFSEQYRLNAQFVLGHMARFFHDAGMIKGFPVVLIWRLSRALPDDVKAALSRRGERNSTGRLRLVRSNSARDDR